MGFTYGSAEHGLFLRYDNQVHMIRHQAVMPYFDTFFFAPVGDQSQIFLVILIPEKYILSAVAALGYVMWNSGYHHSFDSGHTRNIALIGIVSPYYFLMPNAKLTCA